MGHLRLTIGYLKTTVVHIRVTLSHLRVTIGYFFYTQTEGKHNWASPQSKANLLIKYLPKIFWILRPSAIGWLWFEGIFQHPKTKICLLVVFYLVGLTRPYWAILLNMHLEHLNPDAHEGIPTFALYHPLIAQCKIEWTALEDKGISIHVEMYWLASALQGLCRLGLEFFSNGPENIYPHQTK